MIRLAAFDIDQTLVSNDLILSPRLKRAIACAQERGVTITLVTGRGTRFTTQVAHEFGLSAPVVCYQGGLVYDILAGRALHEVLLPQEMLPYIVAAMEQYGWNLHFEAANHLYLPRVSNHPPIYFEFVRVTPWSRVDNLLTDLPCAPNKFIVTANHPSERDRLIVEMEQAFDGQINVIPSHPYLVEGLPAGVDKGQGLAWLAGYLGIDSAEVLAVGDNDNDVPMLEWAGVGVAVGNCSPAACAAADWIAPPVQEDGAALAIEKYILG